MSEIERAAAAIRANPEPHHTPLHPIAANDDWLQKPDTLWGVVIVGASVFSVIASLVMVL